VLREQADLYLLLKGRGRTGEPVKPHLLSREAAGAEPSSLRPGVLSITPPQEPTAAALKKLTL